MKARKKLPAELGAEAKARAKSLAIAGPRSEKLRETSTRRVYDPPTGFQGSYRCYQDGIPRSPSIKDPPGLPKAIEDHLRKPSERKESGFPSSVALRVDRDRMLKALNRATKSKSGALRIRALSQLKGQLGLSHWPPLPYNKPGRPYWEMLRGIHSSEFNMGDPRFVQAVTEACSNNDWAFFEEMVRLKQRYRKRPAGEVDMGRPDSQTSRDHLIIRNWIRLHDLDIELPGLCWFSRTCQTDIINLINEEGGANGDQHLSKISTRVKELGLQPAEIMFVRIIELPNTSDGKPSYRLKPKGDLKRGV